MLVTMTLTRWSTPQDSVAAESGQHYKMKCLFFLMRLGRYLLISSQEQDIFQPYLCPAQPMFSSPPVRAGLFSVPRLAHTLSPSSGFINYASHIGRNSIHHWALPAWRPLPRPKKGAMRWPLESFPELWLSGSEGKKQAALWGPSVGDRTRELQKQCFLLGLT